MKKEGTLFALAAAALLATAGCSSDSGSKADAAPGETPDASPVDAGGGADADYGDWLVLNEGSWTIPVSDGTHGDPYYCIITTIQEDTYIKAFKGLTPPGTHHTVLTIYDGTEPDGIVPCNAGTNGQSMIYGTGVGTPEFNFPPGVAVKLSKGQRILNNLHLFNATDGPLSGTSGTLYKPAMPSEVQHEAEIVLTGPVSLNIPKGESVTQTGSCHISNITSEPIHVFSLSPHMHRLGKHLKSTLIRGNQQTVIQDVDYSFESQTFTLQNPFIDLQPGDVLQTDCTYNNPSDTTVHWGTNSSDEMCFTDIFYYPKQGAMVVCPF